MQSRECDERIGVYLVIKVAIRGDNKMKRRRLLPYVLRFTLLVGIIMSMTSCSTEELQKSDFSDSNSVGPAVFSASDITSTGLTLEITNTSSEYRLEYYRNERRGYDNGHGYRLEQKNDDDWYVLNVVIDDTTIDSTLTWQFIMAGDTMVKRVDWEYLYGELLPGEYRMLFRLSTVNGIDYDKHSLIYENDFYIPIYFEIE